ncbi:MAG: oligopeptide ABC transporter permease OppB [Deltaproteobacteria bacterium]|jgi:oligopeptide transport system permease protein|nr:oligopeptide ABC transporter permease OppB [Deltaproteobacteria bacterium]
MTKFIIRRFLGIFPTLFIIVSISFFLIRAAPGGPFDTEKAIPAEVLVNIEAKFHMDEPLVVQYGRYMYDILRGDLGPSFRYPDHDVNYFIANSFPISIQLGTISIVLALILGISTGIISALRQNTWIDYSTMGIAIIGISIPTFVVGPILMYFLAMKLHWLPTSGWITGRHGYVTLIMPVITLSLPFYAYFARISRASIIEVLRSDYIRTARAKGLSGPVIIIKHVLKGAMLPVVSFLGPALAGILTGSVVIEKIFRIPGLGKFFVQSAFNRDYTIIMGTVIVYAVMLVVLNFIVDIVYSFLDPRIAYK